MARTYRVRFVHKIAPSDTDVSEGPLADGAFSDRRTLAKALRDGGFLSPGDRLRGMRVEGDKCVAFPDRGIWHSLIIDLG